jgi:hypothetical protein
MTPKRWKTLHIGSGGLLLLANKYFLTGVLLVTVSKRPEICE